MSYKVNDTVWVNFKTGSGDVYIGPAKIVEIFNLERYEHPYSLSLPIKFLGFSDWGVQENEIKYKIE